MDKDKLLTLGLTDEQAEKVLEAIAQDYVPKATHDELVTAKANLEQSVSDRDQQLEDLRKTAGDNADLQQQIRDLQDANANQKKEHEAAMHQVRVDHAVDKALAGARAKNTKAVRALLDLNEAKLDKDGTVIGLKEQIDKLTAGEDTKFLFDAAPTVQFRGFQPGAAADVLPNPKTAVFQTQLAEARKNNDMVSAIKIKQDAAAAGVVLL